MNHKYFIMAGTLWRVVEDGSIEQWTRGGWRWWSKRESENWLKSYNYQIYDISEEELFLLLM